MIIEVLIKLPEDDSYQFKGSPDEAINAIQRLMGKQQEAIPLVARSRMEAEGLAFLYYQKLLATLPQTERRQDFGW